MLHHLIYPQNLQMLADTRIKKRRYVCQSCFNTSYHVFIYSQLYVWTFYFSENVYEWFPKTHTLHAGTDFKVEMYNNNIAISHCNFSNMRQWK